MVFRYKINTYADRLPFNIEEQIRGAAEGSGLPIQFFKEIQVFPDLFAKRCEGIVIKKGYHTYHAHNLDQSYPISLLSQYPVVVNYNIKGKQQFTDFGFVAVLMPTTAFNESGISISENGNNNPFGFDKENCTLYSEKSKLITETHNLKEVDSIARTLKFPIGLLLTIGNSKEQKAAVYDFIGSSRAATPIQHYQFVANRTVAKKLGKKSETIYSGNFHDIGREMKFDQLIDTTKHNMVDEIICMLSNIDFYHYTDSVSTYIEALHNYETDQSVIFDLADSTIYFACYPHYAAWSRWLKYNYYTHKVSVFQEANPRLSSPLITRMNKMLTEYESCDWRDSSNVRSLVHAVIASGIENYFSLDFLSTTYLNYYKSPEQAEMYADALIEKYPDIITGYYDKGRALDEEKKYDKAISEYHRALDTKIQCEYYLAVTNERLALSYYSIGNKVLASEYASKALEIHTQYWISDYMEERIQMLEKIKNKID
jgi:hypothetical protein